MIDLHCHVLPGIDDGPPTAEGSAAMLRAAAAAGIETMVATPHVSARYLNDAGTIAAAAATLEQPLLETGIELLQGAEVAVTRVAELDPRTLSTLHLADGPWLLLEPPFASVAHGVPAVVAELHRRGHRVLLAHPERCAAFQRDPAQVAELVGQGVLTSLTSGSLVGRFGSEAQRLGFALLEAGLAHNVTSDAHDEHDRPPSIAAELEAAGLQPLQDWLTREIPMAILSGGSLPRRPQVGSLRPLAGRRRAWPWRR